MSKGSTAKDQQVTLEANLCFTLCLSIYTESKRKYWRCLWWFSIADTLHLFSLRAPYSSHRKVLWRNRGSMQMCRAGRVAI